VYVIFSKTSADEVHLPQSTIKDFTVLSEGGGGQISNTDMTC